MRKERERESEKLFSVNKEYQKYKKYDNHRNLLNKLDTNSGETFITNHIKWICSIYSRKLPRTRAIWMTMAKIPRGFIVEIEGGD